MGYYDLYGYYGVEIYDAQKMLEDVIKITFKEKESLYYGGIYLLSGDKRHEHFLLKENYDVLDGVVDEVQGKIIRSSLFVLNNSHFMFKN
ncbi:hypothetical protein [Escherichia fergusonii]|uniref:hypothetical protein n=1 Tax=Escherichia fergusonii TaxID=564 RepID=UPI000AC75285|nr:hypothetical protein [Escherichia fergusonii]